MTPKEQWSAVDQYVCELLVKQDAALEAALQASAEAGLPPINVSPAQGKLLHLLARLSGAKRILEIGTLGGYSTIWLARALPEDGKLITLEADLRHAAVARENFSRAGLSQRIDLREGPALQTLPRLAAEAIAPFDLTFIDADKSSTADYFTWALKLSHPGSVVVVDNVVRSGAVIDHDSADLGVQGIRRFNDLLARESRVSATAIQTVGQKGYDGFAIAVVLRL